MASKFFLAKNQSSGISNVLIEKAMGSIKRAKLCQHNILLILYKYTGTLGSTIMVAAYPFSPRKLVATSNIAANTNNIIIQEAFTIITNSL